MKKTILAIIALMAATAAIVPATAQTFTALHVFNGTPDGAFSEAPVVQDAAGNLFGTTTSGGGDNGTVFKIDASGHESVLFSFNGSNGGFPNSGLILDKAGNLYGTAEEGPGGAGVVFRVDPNGNEEILHAFQGGFNTESANPSGGVIMDAAGNLFGATISGGLGPFPGFGTLYSLDPAGNFTVLYKFQGQSDGANPQGPLVRDAQGNLYGVAPATDTAGKVRGTVFKLAPDGTLTVLHTFTGGKDGSAPQGGLLLDNLGNLFGAAGGGGDTGNGTIFEITKAGTFRRLYSFKGTSDGKNPNGELVRDSAGNIFGTAQSGPNQFVLGTVFELSRTGTLTVLHTFTGNNDGAVPLAGLIRDRAGNLFGTTVKNFLIQQVQGGGVFRVKP